jgi:hypothetical protein
MSRLLTLIIICLLCSGCGLSARQAQNLADGLAGIEAVQPQVATNPSASLILSGAHDHIEAVAVEARETLPAPLRSPAGIAANATGYADNARQAVDDAHHTIPWWGWIAGIGTSLLAILRFVPGAGGAVADTAWRMLAPTATKEQDRTRDIRAQGFTELVGVIERLRPDQTIAQLKSKVATATSSTVQDDIRRLVRGQPGALQQAPSAMR